MKSAKRRLILAMCGAVALALAAATPSVLGQTTERLGDILELSNRLYEEGMTRGDGVLVFAAARLRLLHLPIEPTSEGAGWISGAAMLRTAENLAASDATLSAMIARQREDIPRGGLNGPQVDSVRVDGAGEARLTHRFKRGAPAYVYAEGAQNTQLSIVVLDQRRPVCRTRIESGRAMCRWVAAREGAFTTIVRNLSPEATTILVVTN